MKKKILAGLSLGFLACLGSIAFAKDASASIDMYRLYNPNSGEHFYTSNTTEKSILKKAGWRHEGVAWVAPNDGEPIYRLYNPNVGDHHYTMSAGERDHLVKVGWRYEGISWHSAANKAVPMWRLYNPKATTGSHHYTSSEFEKDQLAKLHGWQTEGIAWYGESMPKYPRAIDQEDMQGVLNYHKQGFNVPNYVSIDFNSKQISYRTNNPTIPAAVYKFTVSNIPLKTVSVFMNDRPGVTRGAELNTKITPTTHISGNKSPDMYYPMYLYYNENGKISLVTPNYAGNVPDYQKDVMLEYLP